MPSVALILINILITWPARLSGRLRIVRLKESNLVRCVSYAVGIVAGQVMHNTARTIRRWEASICRHNDGVMGTDSCPYAAIVSNVALERCILIASLILEMKIGLSFPIATMLDLFFP